MQLPHMGMGHTHRSRFRDVANTMAASWHSFGPFQHTVRGTAEKSLHKLQRVQNKFARVVCNVTARQQHSVDLICNLHWLPSRSRIMFKVATLCFKHTGSINRAFCSPHWSHPYISGVDCDRLRYRSCG